MTDKNKNTGDEYQFPHDEYVTAEDEAQQPSYDAFNAQDTTVNTSSSSAAGAPKPKPGLLKRFPILQNKRVLVVVGIVVVVFVGFQMTKPSHKATVIKQVKPVQQQHTSRFAQQQQSTLLNKVNRISQAASNTQDVENQLNSKVSQLAMSLHHFSDSNKAMRAALIALANQVQVLSAQVRKATTKPSHIKKSLPTPVLTFTLRAIIPGRAWVVGSNGESDSVALGDTLKHYGKVTAIYPNAGKVITSSGKIITYNHEGN